MFARMQIRESSWESFLDEYQICETGAACDISENLQSMLRNGEIREIEAENPIGFVMLSCIGSEDDIDEFYDYFNAPDKFSSQPWKWNFNGKVNFATEYTGQHNDILDTQPNTIEYDENGNPVGSTEASFEDPNWVNAWFGQGSSDYIQRFARAYSRGFGEGFS